MHNKLILPIAGVIFLYQFVVSLQIALYAFVALLLGSFLGMLMTCIVVFAQCIRESTHLIDIGFCRSMVLPIKILFLSTGAFVMSLCLVSAPYFVIRYLNRKQYSRMAIACVLFAVMQFATNQILASPPSLDVDQASRKKATNLYPYAQSCIVIFLFISGAAVVGHAFQLAQVQSKK